MLHQAAPHFVRIEKGFALQFFYVRGFQGRPAIPESAFRGQGFPRLNGFPGGTSVNGKPSGHRAHQN